MHDVYILYTNWLNDRRWRKISPERLFFGECQWHPGEQWLLEAIDLDAPGMYRKMFAMKDIHQWRTTPPEPVQEVSR